MDSQAHHNHHIDPRPVRSVISGAVWISGRNLMSRPPNNPPHRTPSLRELTLGGPRPPRAIRAGWYTAAAAVSAFLLAGCGNGSGTSPTTQPLLLSGPKTDIVVTIPDGWHQVIDSTNPAIPEMVSPTTCMGNQEVNCATGLARLASLTAPSAEAAAHTIEQAITTAPGVKPGATLSQGPEKVGHHDGYRQRFAFTNPGATLTAEIAAVASGPTTPDPQGNHEFSIVMVWISNKPAAPHTNVIDQIINSAQISGGPPPS